MADHHQFKSPIANALWDAAEAMERLCNGALLAAAGVGTVYLIGLIMGGSPKSILAVVTAGLGGLALVARIVANVCDKRANDTYDRDMTAWMARRLREDREHTP